MQSLLEERSLFLIFFIYVCVGVVFQDRCFCFVLSCLFFLAGCPVTPSLDQVGLREPPACLLSAAIKDMCRPSWLALVFSDL